MSNNTNDPTENDPDIPGLREAAKAGKAAQERADQLARENMFLRAGIDLDNRIAQMLFKTWEGTDLDALKADAAELGLIGEPTQRQTIDPAEAGQQQFRQTFSGPPPAATTGNETPDPTKTAIAQFHEDRKSGVPLENAQLAAFDRILAAAAAGDKRAIFDPVAYAQEAAQYSAGRPRG